MRRDEGKMDEEKKRNEERGVAMIWGVKKMTSLYYHQTNDLPNIHACPVPHHNYIKVIKYSLARQQDVVLLVLTI